MDNVCSCSHTNNLPNVTMIVDYKSPEINITWNINKPNKELPMDVVISEILIRYIIYIIRKSYCINCINK